ncbi:MAG: hypothetical protein DKINENOH_05219 [bacterium]|nr:hypothetical protein [bacterium]
MPRHQDDNQHPHLEFMREDISAERRKKPGFGGTRPDRGGREIFAPKLIEATDRLQDEQNRKVSPIAGIRPHLVFRVPIASKTSPEGIIEILQQAGLAIVSIEPDHAVIAFRDDADLTDFRTAILAYQGGPKINRKTGKPCASTKYDVLELIEPEQMRLWSRPDRIGPRLAQLIGSNADRIEVTCIYIVDLELWHPGTHQEAINGLNEIRQLIQASSMDGERFLDSYIGDAILLAKVAVKGAKLEQLLNSDIVAEVELPPVADFDPIQAGRTTARDFPTPPHPPEDSPRVCIIDSGITSNHPLLASNVGHEEAVLTQTTSPADAHGHGTMVAGLAVFGNVRDCYETGAFSSPVVLLSARVLNDQNQFDDEKLIVNQMREAIETFMHPPHNCRVFNISIGSKASAFEIGKDRQTIWAETLDILAQELKVVLVVSSGNHSEAQAHNATDAEEVLSSYPELLFKPATRLCDPATAAIAVTVGSLAEHDNVTIRRGSDAGDIVRPIASANQPSPMTRIGPGINGAIKPELVHYGGNLVFAGFSGHRQIQPEAGMSVMSFSHQPTETLFAYNIGSSFAAPRVARIAAMAHYQLQKQLGNAPHPNLVRAVLVNSAAIPDEAFAKLNLVAEKHAAIKACGYGLPDADFALNSWDRRVTLIAQEQIKLDHFHIFAVPIPDAFRQARGGRTISVALAFDPPVRRRRYDYLGVEMDMFLIRGKTLNEVHDAFKRVAANEDAEEAIGSPYRVNLEPKASCRSGGYSRKKSTLQRCTFTMKRGERNDYGNEYWLVIRAERKWAPPEIENQDYAIAVTLAADAPELYNQVRQRVRVRQQARGRVRE